MGVTFIGPYYVNADAGGEEHTLPPYITSGLTIGRIIEGKAAPYRIDHDGEAIGWASEDAFEVGLFSKLKVGVSLKISRD